MDMLEIIAQREEIDAIYGEFAEDMKEYLADMKKSIKAIGATVDSMSSDWVDSSYQGFKKSVEDTMQTIEEELDAGNDVRERMLSLKEKLHDQLQKLRAAFGKK